MRRFGATDREESFFTVTDTPISVTSTVDFGHASTPIERTDSNDSITPKREVPRFTKSPARIKWLFLLDNSYSMRGNPLLVAKAVFKYFVSKIDDNASVRSSRRA